MESEISGGDLCEHTAIVRAYRTELESYLAGRGTSIESIQEHAASALRSGIPVAQLAAIHHLAVTTALDRSDGTQALSALTRIACAACPIWDSAQSCNDCTGGADRPEGAHVDPVFRMAGCGAHSRIAFAVVTEIREQEARRLALVVHDRAGQMLTAAHLITAELVQTAPAHQAQAVQQLRTILYNIESDLRDLSHDLRPRVLDDFGVGPALIELGRNFSRRTGIETRVDSMIRSRLADCVETACYRVAEEALTNVRKHSNARTAIVQLRDIGGRIELSVRDDGIGFDQRAGQSATGLGMVGMSERAAALGGRLLISSRPGGGTEVVLSIPSHADLGQVSRTS